jgi:hypothetical protein
MVSILAHAQNLVYTLLSLMPSVYQQENLEAMLGLFLQGQGYPLPQHSKSKYYLQLLKSRNPVFQVLLRMV